ncbi:hypothetical protein [Actinoplanes derwentensis]|uniref:Lipoprotein n=1 Tax=Actinoplanes derwentensis TaxID=113562 RepID=A0A1H1PUH1_9ACTN|nr:hypothetical protein [Actinoplanes derwentensis]GID88430.1 hypothetical protein Ade03nite_73540 [Actinoplanes derwentensis]SDS14766.1 hypothetical protein SAMN04489716_0118 [Actinoplanes derwentensis]
MKLPVTAAIVTVAAVLLSACTSEKATVAPPVAAVPSSAPSFAGPLIGARFFEPIRPGPAMDLKRQPATLKEAYAEATAVIEADVTGVRVGRTIGDMSTVIVTLRPARVLRGALRPQIPAEVEFGPLFDPKDVARVADLMDSFPPARGVWLLRWQGQGQRRPADPKLYHVVHPNCGIFVQDAGHVRAPAAQDDTSGYGAQAEAERFATLAELADHAVMA